MAMRSQVENPLTIDVVSDVVCPWCYIGKRRLEAALRMLAARETRMPVAIRWHPFQLNPEIPAQGIDRRSYLTAKFGGSERAAQVYERVRAAAREAGLDLALDAIERQPNTLDAHRLVAWAQSRGDGSPSDLVERLFRAYFVEGRFVGDRAELARIAGEAGYDAAQAQVMLDSPEGRDAVAGADAHARELGIQGVPFFVFGGRVALSGAHEPATIVDAIDQSRAAAAAGATS
jgi:predicted DsbA family dithiol-disulfide isomerase